MWGALNYTKEAFIVKLLFDRENHWSNETPESSDVVTMRRYVNILAVIHPGSNFIVMESDEPSTVTPTIALIYYWTADLFTTTSRPSSSSYFTDFSCNHHRLFNTVWPQFVRLFWLVSSCHTNKTSYDNSEASKMTSVASFWWIQINL